MRTIIVFTIAVMTGGIIQIGGEIQAQCADGQFSNSIWSAVKILDTSPGTISTFSAASSGNGTPAPGRTTQHNYGAGGSAIRVAHLSSGCAYNPATQGPITTISYKYDAKVAPGGGSVAYRMLVLQNGTYYIGPVHSVTNDASWQSFSGMLSAPMFTAIVGDGPANPDFTCAGSEIRFGYETSNSAGGAAQTISHIDNWDVSWESDHPCAEQPPQCPLGAAATTIGGITYCCVADGAEPIDHDTAQICCTRTCPPGSVETTVNGVTFCCQIGLESTSARFCCKRK